MRRCTRRCACSITGKQADQCTTRMPTYTGAACSTSTKLQLCMTPPALLLLAFRNYCQLGCAQATVLPPSTAVPATAIRPRVLVLDTAETCSRHNAACIEVTRGGTHTAAGIATAAQHACCRTHNACTITSSAHSLRRCSQIPVAQQQSLTRRNKPLGNQCKRMQQQSCQQCNTTGKAALCIYTARSVVAESSFPQLHRSGRHISYCLHRCCCMHIDAAPASAYSSCASPF